MPLKTMCSTKWEMPLSSATSCAGAGAHPYAHGDGADVLHALGEDDETVGQHGTADISFFGHCDGGIQGRFYGTFRCAILGWIDG